MPDYRSMYYKLFNRVTDAINILQEAQRDSEDIFIESRDATLILLDDEEDAVNKTAVFHYLRK
jgi:hypothetical protein